jgi:hypothetical protein
MVALACPSFISGVMLAPPPDYEVAFSTISLRQPFALLMAELLPLGRRDGFALGHCLDLDNLAGHGQIPCAASTY